MQAHRTVPFPSPPEEPPALVDPRFRALLAAAEWARLPAPVRRRFSHRLVDGASHVYRGRVVATTMSRVGRWLSQAARLVGAPLPLHGDTGVAAVVTVTEDVAGRGQHWTRLYARRDGFPQPRPLPVRAGAGPPAPRPAHPPDRRVRGDERMITPTLWVLIAVQVAMGGFDTLVHHEMTEREPPFRPSH